MKIKLSLFCLFLSLSCFSQIRIINERLTDSTLNIFYIGVDNPIRVNKAAPHYRVAIMGGGGAITKTGPMSYIVRVNTTGTCKILVLDGTKDVLAKEYKVEKTGPYFASLNGFYNTTLSKNKVVLNPFLKIISPGTYYKMDYQVVSFSIAFIKNGDSTFKSQTGYNFSKEQFEQAQQLQSGDQLWINNIKVNGPDSRSSTTPSFWIKIE